MVLSEIEQVIKKMSRRKCVYCGKVISDSKSVAKLVEITTKKRKVITAWACKSC